MGARRGGGCGVTRAVTGAWRHARRGPERAAVRRLQDRIEATARDAGLAGALPMYDGTTVAVGRAVLTVVRVDAGLMLRDGAGVNVRWPR